MYLSVACRLRHSWHFRAFCFKRPPSSPFYLPPKNINNFMWVASLFDKYAKRWCDGKQNKPYHAFCAEARDLIYLITYLSTGSSIWYSRSGQPKQAFRVVVSNKSLAALKFNLTFQQSVIQTGFLQLWSWLNSALCASNHRHRMIIVCCVHALPTCKYM